MRQFDLYFQHRFDLRACILYICHCVCACFFNMRHVHLRAFKVYTFLILLFCFNLLSHLNAHTERVFFQMYVSCCRIVDTICFHMKNNCTCYYGFHIQTYFFSLSLILSCSRYRTLIHHSKVKS